MSETIERMVVGWPSWTDDVTWSGGVWSATFPVASLGQMPLSRVARSVGVAPSSTQVIGTFSASRSLSAMGIARHNLSLLSRIRVRLYADAARANLVYDSAWFDTWPSVYLPGDLEWEDDNWWDGKYTAAEIEEYPATRPIWFGKSYFVRAFTVEFDDTSNTAGFVQVGRIEVSQGWQISVLPAPGYGEGHLFRTDGVQALGGVKYFTRRDKPRVARGTIEYLPRDEAMARGFELHRQADLDRVFLWFPFPDETLHWLRTSYLVRQLDPGLITNGVMRFCSFPFSFEEVL